MEGFLWLITQMTLLLTAAAGVFLWLGWRWRGQNAQKQEMELNGRIDAKVAAARAALEERDAARAREEQKLAEGTKTQADLLEANDHRRNLERELIRVHDDLKTAKRDASQAAEDLAEAKAALAPAQAEVSKLATEVEQLRRSHARLEKQAQELLAEVEELRSRPAAAELKPAEIPSDVPPASSPAENAPAAEKPKRVRKTSAEPKAKVTKEPKPEKAPKAPKVAKPFDDAATTLARLETDLVVKQTLLKALQQERDDWQKRVATLREKGRDPAGLGLAQKSLSRAETDVGTAATAVAHLQHQQSALRRSLDQAASITQEDDLTKIKGIKAVLRDHLHAFGIRTFRQISEWTEDDVEAFSELLAFKDRAKRDEWVRQARELM